MKMRRTRKRLITLIVSLMGVFVLLMASIEIRLKVLSFIWTEDGNKEVLLVDTPGCKIPRTNPWDPSIYWYLKSGSDLRCEVQEDIVISRGTKIIINKSVVKRTMPTLSYCKYDVIWRPPNKHTHNNFFVIRNESQPFTDSVEITDEFVRVQCYDSEHRAIYINAFSFVHIKPDVEKKCKHNFRPLNENLNHLSVLMVGVDSVSRSNMIRYMPKTREYLLHEMEALEFVGYNKVADNTFLNIVPMTTGKFVNELPWNAKMVNVSFDKYDFLWKKYSRKGYRTLYSEDSPYGQIFDYQKAGFSKPSADYFDRPLSLVLEELNYAWNANHHCIHARPETSINLEYSKQFVTKFKSMPYFDFAFITRLTHDKISNTRKADKLYLEFLKSISQADTLNNTILMFFSDHGIRFGKLRQTFVGKMEERLPFLFFVLPKWFKTMYSSIYNNFNINTKRLVTPFDIHETLMNILHFSNYKVGNDRSYSLFKEVPINRTCKDAGILPHWCTCSSQTVLSTSDRMVVKVANKFVSELNDQISTSSQCEVLTLKKIMSATKMKPSDVLLKYMKTEHEKDESKIQFGKKVKTNIDFQLMIETSPGGGVFEGTMRFNEYRNSIEMLGDISRINMYGTTSHCVKGIDLKKICYCKKQ